MSEKPGYYGDGSTYGFGMVRDGESIGRRVARDWFAAPSSVCTPEQLAAMVDEAVVNAAVRDSLSGTVVSLGRSFEETAEKVKAEVAKLAPADDITPREAALLAAAVQLRVASIRAGSSLTSRDCADAALVMFAEIRGRE